MCSGDDQLVVVVRRSRSSSSSNNDGGVGSGGCSGRGGGGSDGMSLSGARFPSSHTGSASSGTWAEVKESSSRMPGLDACVLRNKPKEACGDGQRK